MKIISNFRLPEWTQKVFPNGPFRYLYDLSYVLETYTPQFARLKYGILLKEILERFQKKSDLTLKPNRSAWMYSGHDNTISGLLNLMGLYDVSNTFIYVRF